MEYENEGLKNKLIRRNARVSRYLEGFFGKYNSAELENMAILRTTSILRETKVEI
jgi:hypothetical protein